MTHSRDEELKQMLEARRAAIETQVQTKIRGFRDQESSDAPRLQADLADDPGPEDIDFALVQIQSQTLTNIAAALARLEAGEYGVCGECDDEIPQLRLRALPFATRCRTCQETAEQEEHLVRRMMQRGAGLRISMGTANSP
jgi:DnaK suppressor protein